MVFCRPSLFVGYPTRNGCRARADRSYKAKKSPNLLGTILVPHNHSAILRCLMGLYDSSGPAFYNGHEDGYNGQVRPNFSDLHSRCVHSAGVQFKSTARSLACFSFSSSGAITLMFSHQIVGLWPAHFCVGLFSFDDHAA